jgi:tripartite-type tricarboxylate transporter receptor subunit TctC
MRARKRQVSSQAMRMVVGYAPGSGSDIMGRMIAQQITDATEATGHRGK